MQFEELRWLIGDERGVSELPGYLAAGGDINAAIPNSGWTLLHCASEQQNLPMIEALAKAGADLNARNHQGWTPLHLAVDSEIDCVFQSGGDKDDVTFQTVRLLLSLGADPTVRDERGKTPRDVAAAYRMALQYDRLSLQINHARSLRSHPPRCIAGFNATAVELRGAKFDGHPPRPQLNVIFALACSCGAVRHFVHGFRWANSDVDNAAGFLSPLSLLRYFVHGFRRGKAVVFLSPLSLECVSCGKRTDLLDTDAHGYDAELGHGTATVRRQRDPVVYECPRCGRQPLEVFTRFEYPDHVFNRDFKESGGREQDLFTWFSLVAKCPRCSGLLAVADFKCA